MKMAVVRNYYDYGRNVLLAISPDTALDHLSAVAYICKPHKGSQLFTQTKKACEGKAVARTLRCFFIYFPNFFVTIHPEARRFF
jgi:hypothetical protein